jgi:hypothetical protein
MRHEAHDADPARSRTLLQGALKNRNHVLAAIGVLHVKGRL